ncbi:hypothetical protein A3860_31505 [Niastella vici]|uniref:Uncharacterized protein n=1 Tax=Niastella vici TaxID=1703345 RepID=A0A1V9FU00_9BACT|nr:hypothetical protein [Niastella vici]OQP61788.1 hypothetical protein A3860_31505 [Niastella vici]
MELAITDTAITPIDFQKIQSGDPSEFQKLYRKIYNKLLDEATCLVNDQEQSITGVQLSCIQSWIHCEGITSEQYYFGYVRSRLLRYTQALRDDHRRIHHELGVLNELLSVQYERPFYHLANLYENLTVFQKGLIRKTFKFYYQPAPGNPSNPGVGPHPLPAQTLLNYAFYTLHYILV